MIGRFSILKSLDFAKIDKNIEIYEYETGNEPYLFMNHETAKEIYEQVQHTIPFVPDTAIIDGFYNNLGIYKGYRVFINGNLEFGEVEIR